MPGERANLIAYWYLGLNQNSMYEQEYSFDVYSQNFFVQVLVEFFTWYLQMMNFVSISLLVSLEMVKFFQGVWMQHDWTMFDTEKNM